MRSEFSIRMTVRGRVPKLPFADLAERILGPRYELSLVVCADDLARGLNRSHRGKQYAANVLSFALSRGEGEIFLNIRAAEREARVYGVSLRERLALLYVHGLYHLKGMKHGALMERAERRSLRAFGL